MPDGKFTIGNNTKLGPIVGSLNRVPLETCPGKSEWCSEQCYSKRGHFPVWFDEYETEVDMPRELPKLVRLHSSGDFDTPKYVEWVRKLVEGNENTRFWAYTRSWRVDEILPELERLRNLDNVTLFASMDPSIEELPPEEWRKVWIETDDRKQGIKCPHDQGKADNCSECGLCFNDGYDGDIIFEKKY